MGGNDSCGFVDAGEFAFDPLATDRASRSSDSEPVFDHEAAMRKIERLCSVRERSSSSLEERLIRDGFPEDVAANAVARAVECGLVDDGRFADVLVRSRIAAGKGCAGIARELASHGIEASTVESYVEATESGHDSEVARAVSLLNRKPPRAKNVREAAYRRLVGRGFSSAVASSAAREWWESAQGR